MRPLLAVSLALLVAAAAPADDLDPLRLVPAEADALFHVERPRQVADVLLAFEPLKQLGQFAAVKEGLDSTNSRRFFQLVRYYEDVLGAAWPDLIDQLAGGGVAVAGKFAKGPDIPVLLVIQGRDEAKVTAALAAVLKVIDGEVSRQESPDKLRHATHRGRPTHHVGDGFHAARLGAAVVVSNKAAALHKAIDLSIDGRQMSLANHPALPAARRRAPADALGWLWVNLAPVHANPEAKKAYAYPREDANALILIGGITDVVGKSPDVVGAVTREADGFALRARLAAGRDATPAGLALHLPPVGQPGSLPLLEPPGVLLSSSFYLDLATYWTQRTKLLTPEGLKELEDAEKKAGRFLAGRKLSELLQGSGQYHRVVVAQQTDTGYATKPPQPQPAFAVVTSMRDPDFGRAMDGILRAVALLAGAQAKLMYSEEMIDGAKLVCYRFPEGRPLQGDPEGNRYNFSPCFATVGDQFLASSTTELGRQLVRELQKPASGPRSAASSRTQVYAAGGVAAIKAGEEAIAMQAVLDQATPLDAARDEVRRFADWLGTLGAVGVSFDYRASEFVGEVRWKLPSK